MKIYIVQNIVIYYELFASFINILEYLASHLIIVSLFIQDFSQPKKKHSFFKLANSAKPRVLKENLCSIMDFCQ